MPKIDVAALPVLTGTVYPAPYDEAVRGRSRRKLGDAAGLTQFGVNLMRLAPGAASSHRHWHAREDEFLMVLEGEVVLDEDDGETVLRAGDAAGFPAGRAVGHRLVNRTDRDAVILEIGTRSTDDVSSYTQADVDMQAVKRGTDAWTMLRKDGSPHGT